jgi:hypothetical protein
MYPFDDPGPVDNGIGIEPATLGERRSPSVEDGTAVAGGA